MKNIILNFFLTGVISVCFMSSCNKFLEASPPKDQFISEYVFDNDVNALSALAGMYIKIPSYVKSEHARLMSLYADELHFADNDTWNQPFYESYLPYDNSAVNAYWNACYSFIYITNSCIEGVEASSKVTDSLKKQILGEALFFRAFTYFNLVNAFGEVPLVNSTKYQINATLPQFKLDTIYQFMMNDLLQSRDLLKEHYPTSEKIRVNKWAATALLARVYLYREKWEEARKMSNEIIESKRYGVLPACENVFLKNSSEAILHLAPFYSKRTDEAYYYIPSIDTILPTYIITDELYNSFSNSDKRKEKWIGYNEVKEEKYYYPAKYKDRVGTTDLEYLILLRLAEQYLIRAEAYAHLNQFDLAVADLNVIRTRAGISLLTNTDFSSKEELLALILQERRLELFTELGHRWFDLKRFGQAKEVMKAQKPATWEDRALLWPVPKAQLETNPFLHPTPDYN